MKISDVEQLTHHEKVALGHIGEAIQEIRIKQGKSPVNQYLVINTDEPYADEVIDILKHHGHWGMVETCAWCGEDREELRNPHIFDYDRNGGKMCRYCWDHDREVYKGSYGEDIGPFDPKGETAQ